MPRRKKMEGIELSIIVPCLNESENIEKTLVTILNIVKSHNLSVETLVIDDSSTDDTFEKAQEMVRKLPELRLRVFKRPKPRLGYGAVVKYGLARARGRYCIFVAADGVDPVYLLPKFLEVAREGADLVQCSRYLKPGDDRTIPFTYKFYQLLYRNLMKILLRQNIKDSTYAFKLFERKPMLDIRLDSNRFSISPEITFKVLLRGGRIEYVAAGQGRRIYGRSHFSFRKEGFGYAYVLLRAWLHRIGAKSWF